MDPSKWSKSYFLQHTFKPVHMLGHRLKFASLITTCVFGQSSSNLDIG